MARYKVAFTVNGTVHSIRCSSVKVGNMFLQCKDETAQNDQATVGMIPFDAIDYIVHDSVTVSLDG